MAKLTVKGTEYTFGEIMIGPGEALDAAPAKEAAITLVSLSLQAGGHADATPEWIRANFPRWIDGEPAIIPLLNAAYEANGIKTKAKVTDAAGEDQPAGPAIVPSASDSTSTTSTAA